MDCSVFSLFIRLLRQKMRMKNHPHFLLFPYPVTQLFEDCYTDCYAAGLQLGENKACCGAFFCYSPPLLCYATIALGPHFWYFLKEFYTEPLNLLHKLPHVRAIELPWYQGFTLSFTVSPTQIFSLFPLPNLWGIARWDTSLSLALFHLR